MEGKAVRVNKMHEQPKFNDRNNESVRIPLIATVEQ